MTAGSLTPGTQMVHSARLEAMRQASLNSKTVFPCRVILVDRRRNAVRHAFFFYAKGGTVCK